jgi:lysozyme
MVNMKTGPEGRALIEESEKLGPKYNWAKQTGRIVAYLCPQKIPTIGFGHTRGVQHLDVGVKEWSREQADGALDGDLLHNEAYVNGLKLNLNQHQFDALVSLCHNVGSFGETLLGQLRASNWRAAAVTLKRYIHATNGEPCKGRCGNKTCKLNTFDGLIARRATEAKMLLMRAE